MPSCSCDNTAPRPVSLASVSNTNPPSSWGKARIGASTSFLFSASKACVHSSVHEKVFPFSASDDRGLAMVAKSGTKAR